MAGLGDEDAGRLEGAVLDGETEFQQVRDSAIERVLMMERM